MAYRARLASLSLLLIACGGDPAPTDAGVDASAPADAGFDAGPASPADVCDELGLERTAFDPAGASLEWDEVAGDFTVQTLDGPWTLSEHWTGCDSYIFINYSGSAYGTGLWGSSPDPLFTEGPRNVHYFFGSWDPDDAAAETRVRDMQAVVEDGFEFQGLAEADREFWRSHIHYVTTSIRGAGGSVADMLASTGLAFNAFAITRQQRWDPVGFLSELRGGGFAPQLSMARFTPPFYDYLAELDARVAAETGVTVIPLADEVALTDRVLDRVVTLPDATAMAAFDTLEVDVEIICRHDNLQDCSEWDRIAYVHWCETADCSARNEIVRWITPYWRNGRRRWVMDATPLLGLILAGGDQTFRVELGPSWEEATARDVRVSLRLSTRGTADRPIGAERAFTGGAWDATYNTRMAYTFTPPAGTTRVELVTIVSGHGQEPVDVDGAPGGASQACAEWCEHAHTFQIQTPAMGPEHTLDFPFDQDLEGCAARTNEGVPPGQGGNWAMSRAVWCPGLPVPTHRVDITDDVDLTRANEITYRGSSFDREPEAGSMSLSTYLVYFQ